MTSCFICYQDASEQVLCGSCVAELIQVDVAHACPICKTLMVDARACGSCLKNIWYFQNLYVGAYYGVVARYLLHHFKFYQGLLLLPQFSALMIDSLRDAFIESVPQIIVPVPLHPLRMIMRGFNQAHELAKRVGHAFEIDVDPHLARKVKYTKAQARLNLASRGRNLKSSFKVTLPQPIKHVLLIDDVFTTGNTVNALAQAFVKSGVERVDVATLFRVI